MLWVIALQGFAAIFHETLAVAKTDSSYIHLSFNSKMISSSFEEQGGGEEEIPQRYSKCDVGKAKQMLPETTFASPNLRNTVTALHPFLFKCPTQKHRHILC